MSAQTNTTPAAIENTTVRPPPMIEPTLTDAPTLMTCPYCREKITTNTTEQFGAFTFLSIGCFATCCLCCIPCLLPIFKDIKHECSKCGVEVGTFGRVGI